MSSCTSSYKNVFPEPAYVKVPNHQEDLLTYPNTLYGQKQLDDWYESVSSPVSLAVEIPQPAAPATSGKPVVLAVKDVSAKLYRDRTEISRKNKSGHWLTSVRPVTPVDRNMRDFVISSF